MMTTVSASVVELAPGKLAVTEIERMKLAPCHCLFQFYVADGKLSWRTIKLRSLPRSSIGCLGRGAMLGLPRLARNLAGEKPRFIGV